jgi:hypothetical protein
MQPFAVGFSDSGREPAIVLPQQRLLEFLEDIAQRYRDDASLNSQLYWKQGPIVAAVEITWPDPSSRQQ